MPSFDVSIANLIGQIDDDEWPLEVDRLRRVRSKKDLDLIVDTGGWISTKPRDPRLKLVRHNSGTYLVVKYVDGWSTRVSQQDFSGR